MAGVLRALRPQHHRGPGGCPGEPAFGAQVPGALRHGTQHGRLGGGHLGASAARGPRGAAAVLPPREAVQGPEGWGQVQTQGITWLYYQCLEVFI